MLNRSKKRCSVFPKIRKKTTNILLLCHCDMSSLQKINKIMSDHMMRLEGVPEDFEACLVCDMGKEMG